MSRIQYLRWNVTMRPVMQGAEAQLRKLGNMASRAGLSEDAYRSLMNETWSQRDLVPHAIELAANKVRDADAVLFAHDEASPEAREAFRALGPGFRNFP